MEAIAEMERAVAGGNSRAARAETGPAAHRSALSGGAAAWACRGVPLGLRSLARVPQTVKPQRLRLLDVLLTRTGPQGTPVRRPQR